MLHKPRTLFRRKGHAMYEEITTTVASVLALVGFVGSLCSIAAYAEHRFESYRKRKRRKKMMAEKEMDREA